MRAWVGGGPEDEDHSVALPFGAEYLPGEKR